MRGIQTTRFPKLETHHQMKFSVIPRMPIIFVGGGIHLLSLSHTHIHMYTYSLSLSLSLSLSSSSSSSSSSPLLHTDFIITLSPLSHLLSFFFFHNKLLSFTCHFYPSNTYTHKHTLSLFSLLLLLHSEFYHHSFSLHRLLSFPFL